MHNDHLFRKIIARIAVAGPLSFADYMQMALYEPGLGYYSAGAHKFGAKGDFITAPELSPLFSQCVARQCQQVLKDLAGGVILEIGAGSGVMALEILRELERCDTLPKHYYILEVSADLQQRQQQLFQQKGERFYPRLCWLDSLDDIKISGIILANEVIDAMPVHKFLYDGEIKEIYVIHEGKQLAWLIDRPSTALLTEQVQALEIEFPTGYESEINLALPAWIATLADKLDQGVLLFSDYGYPQHEYYHPERCRGTIMCHYQHQAHTDPLWLPGSQDITAHVNFTQIAHAAVASGLEIGGFTHQAAFLMNLNIGEALLHEQDALKQYNIAQQIKRLVLPSEMGELFKVIALTRHYTAALQGFSQMDQVERL